MTAARSLEMCKPYFAACVMLIMPVMASGIAAGAAVPGTPITATNRLGMHTSYGINIITHRVRCFGDTHGQDQIQTAGPETRVAPTPAQPQPAPAQSCRPPLRLGRFLRCPRPRPGQIRDGAASAPRRTRRQSQRPVVRLLASVILPGPGRFRARWTASSGAGEARATPCAQAQCPGCRLFLRQEQSKDDSSPGSPELARRVQERFGIKVHPRSIERALTRLEKKRR